MAPTVGRGRNGRQPIRLTLAFGDRPDADSGGMWRVWIAAALLAGVGFTAGSARADAATERCVTAHAEAQRRRIAGRLVSARTELLVCAQSECPDLIANDCGVWLSEVESSLSSLVFAVAGTGGRDLVDVKVFANDRLLTDRTDGRALTLDPGRYVFRFEADGYTPLNMDVSIRQSEKNRILRAELRPTASAAARSEREAPTPADDGGQIPVATYVLGGAALVGLGAFTYFAVSGKNRLDELTESCGPDDCTERQVEGGKTQYVAADIALGVGVASAIAAVVVYFAASDDDSTAPAESSTRIDAALGEGRAYLQLTSHY